ncbi:hypothetical protein NMY22_g18599 [Coprinellus aureogranulatus]|nr:hypothetical protein NMY22_g18599 [Coprinellus aureogranulatus]
MTIDDSDLSEDDAELLKKAILRLKAKKAAALAKANETPLPRTTRSSKRKTVDKDEGSDEEEGGEGEEVDFENQRPKRTLKKAKT